MRVLRRLVLATAVACAIFFSPPAPAGASTCVTIGGSEACTCSVGTGFCHGDVSGDMACEAAGLDVFNCFEG